MWGGSDSCPLFHIGWHLQTVNKNCPPTRNVALNYKHAAGQGLSTLFGFWDSWALLTLEHHHFPHSPTTTTSPPTSGSQHPLVAESKDLCKVLLALLCAYKHYILLCSIHLHFVAVAVLTFSQENSKKAMFLSTLHLVHARHAVYTFGIHHQHHTHDVLCAHHELPMSSMRCAFRYVLFFLLQLGDPDTHPHKRGFSHPLFLSRVAQSYYPWKGFVVIFVVKLPGSRIFRSEHGKQLF